MIPNWAVCELADGPLFLYIFLEVKRMKNWVDRLVKCGITEETANRVVCFLFRNHRTMELIAYVRMTEEATVKR